MKIFFWGLWSAFIEKGVWQKLILPLGCRDAYYHAVVPLLTQHNTLYCNLSSQASIYWPSTGCEMSLLNTICNVHICHYTGPMGGSFHWGRKRQKLHKLSAFVSKPDMCQEPGWPQQEKSVSRFFHISATLSFCCSKSKALFLSYEAIAELLKWL